jgi:hypothetical protein
MKSNFALPSWVQWSVVTQSVLTAFCVLALVQCEAAFVACGLRPDTRAQDLSLEQFVRFFLQLHQQQEAVGGEADDDSSSSVSSS